MANLNNTLLFASPRNYSADNDRIEIRGTSTPVPEMIDNDYLTHSTEDDVDVNVADADGNPTTNRCFVCQIHRRSDELAVHAFRWQRHGCHAHGA